MQALIAVINHGWPDQRHEVSKSLRPYFPFHHELIADNGLIFKANRIVIPSSMRDDILEQLHYPHVGIEATMRRAKESVFWDTINNDIGMGRNIYNMYFTQTLPEKGEIDVISWSKVPLGNCCR